MHVWLPSTAHASSGQTAPRIFLHYGRGWWQRARSERRRGSDPPSTRPTRLGERARSRSTDDDGLHDDRHLHVIILPGFLIASSSPTYVKLKAACAGYLDARGVRRYSVDVVNMSTFDWLKIALLGLDFGQYLDRAAAQVQTCGNGDCPAATDTVLVGHSAGGWVGRLLIGLGGAAGDEISYNGRRYPGLRNKVKRLITLGTPRYSLERYPFGRVKERVVSGGDGRVFDSSLAFTNEVIGDDDTWPTEVVAFAGVLCGGDGDAPMMTQVSYRANAGHYVRGMQGDGVTVR